MNTILLSLALVIGVAGSAFGLGASISSPQLGFPDGTPPPVIDKVLTALRNDVTFIDGYFINEFSTQRFAGAPSKLGDVIELLHTTGSFAVTVRFADLKDDRIVFALSQNARSQAEVTITINTTKEDFQLAELMIRIPAAQRNLGQDAQR